MGLSQKLGARILCAHITYNVCHIPWFPTRFGEVPYWFSETLPNLPKKSLRHSSIGGASAEVPWYLYSAYLGYEEHDFANFNILSTLYYIIYIIIYLYQESVHLSAMSHQSVEHFRREVIAGLRIYWNASDLHPGTVPIYIILFIHKLTFFLSTQKD